MPEAGASRAARLRLRFDETTRNGRIGGEGILRELGDIAFGCVAFGALTAVWRRVAGSGPQTLDSTARRQLNLIYKDKVISKIALSLLLLRREVV